MHREILPKEDIFEQRLDEDWSWPCLGLGERILGTGKDSREAVIDVFETWTEGSHG